jgi:hypothetical protein
MKSVQETKNHNKANLSEATCMSDSISLPLNIPPKLWEYKTAEADDIIGNFVKKEIYGNVLLEVRAHPQDEQISQMVTR